MELGSVGFVPTKTFTVACILFCLEAPGPDYSPVQSLVYGINNIVTWRSLLFRSDARLSIRSERGKANNRYLCNEGANKYFDNPLPQHKPKPATRFSTCPPKAKNQTLLEQRMENFSETTTVNQVKNDFYKNVIPPTLKRRDQVVISRIIIGHAKITHKYILTKEDQPLCERCKTTLTIDHLILQCELYLLLRK